MRLSSARKRVAYLLTGAFLATSLSISGAHADFPSYFADAEYQELSAISARTQALTYWGADVKTQHVLSSDGVTVVWNVDTGYNWYYGEAGMKLASGAAGADLTPEAKQKIRGVLKAAKSMNAPLSGLLDSRLTLFDSKDQTDTAAGKRVVLQDHTAIDPLATDSLFWAGTSETVGDFDYLDPNRLTPVERQALANLDATDATFVTRGDTAYFRQFVRLHTYEASPAYLLSALTTAVENGDAVFGDITKMDIDMGTIYTVPMAFTDTPDNPVLYRFTVTGNAVVTGVSTVFSDGDATWQIDTELLTWGLQSPVRAALPPDAVPVDLADYRDEIARLKSN